MTLSRLRVLKPACRTVSRKKCLRQKVRPHGRTSFPDVPENAYYALQVSWAKANGIINGTAAGVLEPDTPLTRNEAAVMAARLAKGDGL